MNDIKNRQLAEAAVEGSVKISPELMDQIGPDGTDIRGAYLLIFDVRADTVVRIYTGDTFKVTDSPAGYRISKA